MIQVSFNALFLSAEIQVILLIIGPKGPGRPSCHDIIDFALLFPASIATNFAQSRVVSYCLDRRYADEAEDVKEGAKRTDELLISLCPP